MAEIKKGTVTQISDGGTKAVIRPFGGGSSLTPPLPVQKISINRPAFTAHQNEYNSGEHSELTFDQDFPILAVGDSVAFVLFEDGTGVILCKV